MKVKLSNFLVTSHLISEIPLRKQICELPEEILIKILSHLSTYDLLINVAVVSKQFYSFSKNAKVHNNVSFVLNKFVFQGPVARFLKKATHLRTLEIRLQYLYQHL